MPIRKKRSEASQIQTDPLPNALGEVNHYVSQVVHRLGALAPQVIQNLNLQLLHAVQAVTSIIVRSFWSITAGSRMRVPLAWAMLSFTITPASRRQSRIVVSMLSLSRRLSRAKN